MTDHRRPLQRMVTDWHAGSARVLRAAAVALVCLVAGYLGALALPLSPWSVLALPAGVALAAGLRWGPGAAWGGVPGVLVALLTLSVPPVTAVVSATALATGLLAAHALLRAAAFDVRIERARDVRWLAAGVTGALAPTVALVASSALRFAATPLPGATASQTFVIGWATVATGALLGASSRCAAWCRRSGCSPPSASAC
jgi:hypothetical protein